jgi:DNA-binding PadR family transcriptional regulator
MSIRFGLLALLAREPMYGYQLRTEFEGATGATWPLNVGQVYTTLTRLERDGLVDPQGEDDEGRVRFAINAAGRAALMGWFDGPVVARDRPRDQLAIKLALAVTVPGVDVATVVQRQRSATVSDLQELTRLKQHTVDDLPWGLVLESLRFHAEAEVRWLDHCEIALTRAARRSSTGQPHTSVENAAAPARQVTSS